MYIAFKQAHPIDRKTIACQDKNIAKMYQIKALFSYIIICSHIFITIIIIIIILNVHSRFFIFCSERRLGLPPRTIARLCTNIIIIIIVSDCWILQQSIDIFDSDVRLLCGSTGKHHQNRIEIIDQEKSRSGSFMCVCVCVWTNSFRYFLSIFIRRFEHKLIEHEFSIIQSFVFYHRANRANMYFYCYYYLFICDFVASQAIWDYSLDFDTFDRIIGFGWILWYLTQILGGRSTNLPVIGILVYCHRWKMIGHFGRTCF